MNPDQSSQPVNSEPEEHDKTNPMQPMQPSLPSSAPDWQQQAVNGAAAQTRGETPVAGEPPAAPAAGSFMDANPTATPSVPGDPSPSPVVSGGMPTMQSPVVGQPSQAAPTAGLSPMMPASQMSGSNGGSGMMKRIIMVVVLLIVLGGLGFLAYKGLQSAQRSHDKNATNNAIRRSQSSTSAPDINTLSNVSLTEPDASKMSGFTATPSTTQNAPSTLVNTDQSCVILYGVLNQTGLPGTDIGDIVAKATQTIRSQGITITGPNTEQALVLKDVATSKSYSLPTVGFSYSKSGTTEVAVYSISQLKDGTHAAVLQVCYGQGATVSSLNDKINTVTKPVAQAIGVQTQ